ncbi:hypothetical protein E3E12_04145 [Formicincola oecophyllae]|uniref:DAGKc domain-containing protein n=1 Tax=Formicincola oecophyllae TaxID=2558361 RepID=A0A4Y6U942_9PROT|nr:diacylglycerol kinase family protein [Formicincola oecophyllae]QDH13520.1 hypothetical protein E3E12_04145 [Formicincola oecophyllae]
MDKGSLVVKSASCVVIANPASGHFNRYRLERLLSACRRQGLSVQLRLTEKPGHGAQLALEAAQRHVTVIIAAGGDGTMAEVASGIMACSAVQRPIMALFPMGTVNLLVREWGLPSHAEACAARVAGALRSGNVGRIYPGWLHRVGSPPQLFLQMLGAGFDGAVVQGVNPWLKQWVGRGAYGWAIMKTGLRLAWCGLKGRFSKAHRAAPLIVTLDPGTAGAKTLSAVAVIVARGKLYAGPWPLVPTGHVDHAAKAHPCFSVITLHSQSLNVFLSAGLALVQGRFPQWVMRPETPVSLTTATEVALTPLPSAKPFQTALQADGDGAGHAPCKITGCSPGPRSCIAQAQDSGQRNDYLRIVI